MEAMKLHHVGYVVSDMDATLESLRATMGELTCQHYAFRPMKAWCLGKEVPEYHLKIAMVTPVASQTCIEVIQPVSEGYHMDFVRKTDGGGINHICFSVDNGYDDVRAAFAARGAEFVFESETEDDVIGYRRCFYSRDLQSNIIEVKETPYFREKK